MRYSFGEFVLDQERRELLRGSAPIRVSPKAFTLLEILLGRAPNVVKKNELYRELWGDIFVDDTNIANLVSELRAALGDDSREPRYIRTLHRVGYRFEGKLDTLRATAPARSVPGKAWLVWVSREFPLVEGENIIGRDPEAHVWLDSAKVSRRHARLIVSVNATIEDLGSKNGTFVQGQRIAGRAEIHDGDTIGLGSIRLTFRSVEENQTTLTDLKAPGDPSV